MTHDTFFFGAATSAHQVEGGNRNDWSEWEKKMAKSKAQMANGTTWPKYILDNYPSPLQPENYVSGRACDHHNRYEEDFDIAKKLGHTAHRFSIEWSRIEPEEGVFNKKEIDHYRRVVAALRRRDIEPFITLWHFTNPLWFSRKGGWASRDAPHYFSRYCRKISSEFKDLVRFIIPLNEPNIYCGQSYLYGTWPPEHKNFVTAVSVFDNFIKAHRESFSAIASIHSNFQVGIAYNLRYSVPVKNPAKNAIRSLVNYFRYQYFLKRIKNALHFIGLNYYTTYRFMNDYSLLSPQEKSEFLEWEIFPEGIYHLIKFLSRYGKPIYITENGIADNRDAHRELFIREHLQWIRYAMAEGADVRGYFYWSLIDNFEWDKGFWPRFGLVEVDYKTMKRKIRRSAWAYKTCMENFFEK